MIASGSRVRSYPETKHLRNMVSCYTLSGWRFQREVFSASRRMLASHIDLGNLSGGFGYAHAKTVVLNGPRYHVPEFGGVLKSHKLVQAAAHAKLIKSCPLDACFRNATDFYEPVAQLVEHRTFNAVVAGSSPARLTIISIVSPLHYNRRL